MSTKGQNTKGQGTPLNPNPKVGFPFMNNDKIKTLHFNHVLYLYNIHFRGLTISTEETVFKRKTC